LIFSEKNINFDHLTNLILNGSVFCYPTETLYGMGCIYSNQDSITKIFNIKNRNVKQKMSLLFKDFKMLNDLFYINALEKKIIKTFLPGKLSILLEPKKSNNFNENLVGDNGKISCRISSHDFVINLFSKINFPIISTSANVSGNQNIYNSSFLINEFSSKVDFIVDYGDIKESKGSTIINIVNNNVNLLREGDIPSKKIMEVI